MPIRWSPDCAAIGAEGCFGVALISSIKLSEAEKLHALRRLDQFWEWRSLDEKRYCLVCGEMITGRQILVIGKPTLKRAPPPDLSDRTLQCYPDRMGAANRGSLDKNCNDGG